MSLNLPEAWPPPPTLPPPSREPRARWKLPITLPADRNWLVTFTDSEIVFRRPPRQRILAASLCFLSVLSGLISLHNVSHRLAHSGWFEEVTNYMMFLLWGGFGMIFATPKSLTLDLKERTYHFHYTPLLLPKTVTGSWNDIASLTIVGGSLYTVELRWAETMAKSRPRPTLGQYSDKPTQAAAARTLMRRVAAKLGVPCAYPYLFDIKYPELLPD